MILALIRRLLAPLTVLALALPAQAAEPRRLDLVMTPHATGDADSYLAVRMGFEAPGLKSGAPLVRLPLKIVGVPTARYDGAALTARDDAGPLPLTQSEEAPTPQGTYRRWSVGRDTVGDVVVSYRAPPRPVTAATNNGPLFDLREDGGGFVGAGIGFIATPVAEGPWKVRLHWDLSGAAPGSRGVWSLGEGDVERVVPSDTLAFSYYAVGPLKTYPAKPDPLFAVYGLSDTPFDAEVLADRIHALYASMAAFFHDEGGSYRVFMRRNPYPGTGGTALAHSFAFGFNPESKPTVDNLQMLVAHEMAHTWPAMEGEHGDTAWYSEGTAEYYSLALSWRAGALSLDRVIEVLNDRADAYYANPYRALTNPEAAKRFWTDPIAQTIPYGRGWLYLVETDAQIREVSKGRRSLDDVVQEIRRRQVAGQPHGVPAWLELVGHELGEAKARAGYDHMAGGGLMMPPANAFGPCLTVVKHAVRPFDLGFAPASLNDARVIRDLRPDAAAAAAGVREGDVVTEVAGLNEARKSQAQTLKLSIRRGDSLTNITYLPRGAPTEGYRWARTPGVPVSACRF